MGKALKGRLVLFVALMGFILFAATDSEAQPIGLSTPPPSQSPGSSVLTSPQGRYVFGQISSSAKDQFMLDTATGRLWRISESGKIGVHLKAVPYCDEKGECSPFPPRMSN